MALATRQRLELAHRGRRIRGTKLWHYDGELYEIDRPADGDPPVEWRVPCPVCERWLGFQVHSVAATRRRRGRRWLLPAMSLAVVAVALVLSRVTGLDHASLFAVAFICGWLPLIVTGGIAFFEKGITGNGTVIPLGAEHRITLR